MSWPWETRTSTCLNFATISSGLSRFLAIAALLDVETYLKSDHFVRGGSLSDLHLDFGPGHLALDERRLIARRLPEYPEQCRARAGSNRSARDRSSDLVARRNADVESRQLCERLGHRA